MLMRRDTVPRSASRRIAAAALAGALLLLSPAAALAQRGQSGPASMPTSSR